MFKKISSISKGFTDKAGKAYKRFSIENPGTDKALKVSGTIVVLTGAAVAAPFIPAVTAAVGGAAALAGVGWSAQSGLSRDMDKQMNTWTNLAGQTVRSTKEYELHFSQSEIKMLKLAKDLKSETKISKINKISTKIQVMHEELIELAADFKVIVINQDGSSSEKSYRCLSNEQLITEVKSRTSIPRPKR